MMCLNFTMKHVSLFDSKANQENIYAKLDEFWWVLDDFCAFWAHEFMANVVSNEISLLQTSGQICVWWWCIHTDIQLKCYLNSCGFYVAHQSCQFFCFFHYSCLKKCSTIWSVVIRMLLLPSYSPVSIKWKSNMVVFRKLTIGNNFLG